MHDTKLSIGGCYSLLLILAATIGLIEYGGLIDQQGSLLLTLTFWGSIIQGAVAVAAVTALVRAKWIASLRRELLALYPLLLLLALLFALLWPQLDLFPWSDHPTVWLNRPFFMGRNLASLLLTFLAGRQLALHSARGVPFKDRYAVIYLAAFVLSQSLIGFDWLMSAAYPWISTMFGLYFFTEALYAGIAVSGLAMLLYFRPRMLTRPQQTARHLRDVGLLLFGFSILWAGLFFAQFLLIWYANLPEEVHFVTERLASSPERELCWLFLLGLFLIPFVVLLGSQAKGDLRFVSTVSLLVLTGLFAERLFILLPAIPSHTGALLLYNGLIFIMLLLTLHSSERLLPSASFQTED
jgi:hypothetical protein